MILEDSFLWNTVLWTLIQFFKYHLYFLSKFRFGCKFVTGIAVLMLVIMERHYSFYIFMKINFTAWIQRRIQIFTTISQDSGLCYFFFFFFLYLTFIKRCSSEANLESIRIHLRWSFSAKIRNGFLQECSIVDVWVCLVLVSLLLILHISCTTLTILLPLLW